MNRGLTDFFLNTRKDIQNNIPDSRFTKGIYRFASHKLFVMQFSQNLEMN